MANGIDIKIGTLFDKSGITEANKSLARLAQDVKAANGNLREAASAAGLDMAREADKACLAQVGAYAKVEQQVVEVAEATTKAGEKAKEAGAAASKSFGSLEMILGLCRGSTEQVAKAIGGLVEKIPLIGKFGLGPISAFIAALTSVFKLITAIKDLVRVAFNLDAVPKSVSEASARFADLNNAAEQFKVKMNEAREIAERQKKFFDEEVDAINRMTKAENELKRSQELSLAVTQEQKDEINRRYNSMNAEADETAAQDKRDNERKSLRDEERRIRAEIKDINARIDEYAQLNKAGSSKAGEAGIELLDELAKKKQALKDNRRRIDALNQEDEVAQTLIEARQVKEETAAVEAEERKEAEMKKAAERMLADAKKKVEERKREELKAVEERRKADEQAAEAARKLEEQLHAQRLANIKSEIAAKESAANGIQSVAQQAQTEFDRAFAMYRSPEQAAAQIADERDYAADYKQLQRDASRYGGKWRIDELSRLMAAGDTAGQAATLEEWRKSSRFTPEVEAMVRAAAADKTRTTAEDELRQINANTKGLSQKLDELLKMKG